VTVRNTNLSTVTGTDGSFALNAPENSTLVFSYVDFQTTEQPASSVMSVALARGENALSEVVVVGYGTRLRRDVTSSISKVTNRDFQNLPLPSFEQALQGRAAGVFINSGSGKLGQGLRSVYVVFRPFPLTSSLLW
jgi:hypothetical protein